MKKHEDGQSLVIIALMFLGLVAIAALVVDGGSLYLNRRSAQTAADAAAMAGARTLCVDNGDVTAAVNKYALTENGATLVDAPTIVTVADTTTGAVKSVSVRTTVTTTSFIANVIGFKNNTVTAEATAGCFIPKETKNMLPIAWTCRPLTGGDTSDCSIHSIPWQVFKTFLSPSSFNFSGPTAQILDAGLTADDLTPAHYNDGSGSKMAYLVMDSNDFDTTLCKPTGQLNCDMNGDGILDVDGGANRGWLMLGDKGGAAQLKDIIKNGYPDPITIPQWFPGTNGVAATLFDNAESDAKYQVLYVPVFNAVCSGIPTTATCPDYTAGELINTANTSTTYYRVASFAPFVITCVRKITGDKCPAREYALKDYTGSINWNPVKSIEGYFVSGNVDQTSITIDGFDFGNYVISLMK